MLTPAVLFVLVAGSIPILTGLYALLVLIPREQARRKLFYVAGTSGNSVWTTGGTV